MLRLPAEAPRVARKWESRDHDAHAPQAVRCRCAPSPGASGRMPQRKLDLKLRPWGQCPVRLPHRPDGRADLHGGWNLRGLRMRDTRCRCWPTYWNRRRASARHRHRRRDRRHGRARSGWARWRGWNRNPRRWQQPIGRHLCWSPRHVRRLPDPRRLCGSWVQVVWRSSLRGSADRVRQPRFKRRVRRRRGLYVEQLLLDLLGGRRGLQHHAG